MVKQTDLVINSRNIPLLVDKLNEYGVVIIPEYLGAEDIEQLKVEFEDFLSSEDTPYKKKTPYSDGRAARVDRETLDTKRYPKTSEVFSAPFMRELTDAFWGKETKLNREIFVVNDVVGSKHVANDLHFDIKPTFKFFIYLTDTTAENGAFSCVPGSHKLTPKLREEYGEKISFDNRDQSRELPVKEEEEVIPIEGKAGSLIIFTTETFHKAGFVSKGERLVMRGHCRKEKQEKIGKNSKQSLVGKFLGKAKSLMKV